MQSVVPRLQKAIDNNTQTLIHRVLLAFSNEYDESVEWATVGTSVVGGSHLVKGNYDTVTEWDKYKYIDISKDVINYEFQREMDFPVNRVIKSRASLVLNNTDGRYFNLRNKRFIKILSGYDGFLLPQFVGITERPVNDIKSNTTTINCFDILDFLEGYKLEPVFLIDKRTDEVIEYILNEIGFIEGQYDLEPSISTIPFTWIESENNALDVIRKLCEAEDGLFFVDEYGVMRFHNRFHIVNITEPQFNLNYSNINNLQLEPTEVINKVLIKSYPREVKPNKLVWESRNSEEYLSGETKEVFAQITDINDNPLPCTNIYEPTALGNNGSLYEANSENDESGIDRTSDIEILEFSILGGTTVKIVIKNNSANPLFLTKLVLFGTPAEIIKEIEYETPNSLTQDSIDEFGEQVYELDNDFIQTPSFARNLANMIVLNFKDPTKSTEVEIKGNPALQLNDFITISDHISKENYTMYINKLQKLTNGYNQRLLLRERVIQSFAVVGTSVVDGDDIVAP